MTDLSDLTPRQLAVVRLLAAWKSYRQIGAALGMAPRTVKCHVATVALKLDNPDSIPAKTLVWLWAKKNAA